VRKSRQLRLPESSRRARGLHEGCEFRGGA